MSDNEKNTLPTVPVDILRSAGEIISSVNQELVQALGRVAHDGVTAESQQWTEELADVLEAIREQTHTTLALINDLPVYEEPAPIQTVIEVIEEQPVAEVPQAPEVVEIPIVTSGIEAEPAAITAEPEIELVTETTPELVEESDELSTDTAEEADEDGLDETQQLLIDYICENGPIHIGRLVRDVYQERLSRVDYNDLIDALNHLADRGHIVHHDGPNYGPVTERSFMPEVAVEEPREADYILPEDSETPTEISQESVTETLERVVLSSVEAAIIEYARTRGAFRMEEMRRELQAVIDLSDEAYAELKKSFKEFMPRASQALSQQGVSAEWATTGKARGVRYELIVTKVQLQDTSVETIGTSSPVEKVPVKKDSTPVTPVAANPKEEQPRYYDRLARQMADGIPATETAEEASDAVLSDRQKLIQAARLATRMTAALQELETQQQAIGLRRTQVAKDMAGVLGVTVEEVVKAFSRLEAAGSIYAHPGRKGARIISTYPAEMAETNGNGNGKKNGLTNGEDAAIQDVSAELFNEDERKIVQRIIVGLSAKDVRLGIKIKSLWLENLEDEEIARTVITKLSNLDVIERFQPKRQRASHSRRNTEPFIRFTDHDLWRQSKKDIRSVIQNILAVDLSK